MGTWPIGVIERLSRARQKLFGAGAVIALFSFVVLGGAAATTDLGKPSPPVILGPRVSEKTHLAYTFRSHERGVPPSSIRFRCAQDSRRLRSCTNPYKVTLAVGNHVLRAQAVGPNARVSRTSRARIRILPARAPEIRVGAAPLNAIAVGDTVWTENYGDGSVSIVDTASGSARSVKVGGSPGGIAYGAGSVWVSDLSGGPVTRLDLSGRVLARVSVPGQGAGVAVSGRVVYVADYSGGLTRIDADTNAVLGHTTIRGNPEAVAVGFGRVWVTNQNGSISTLDPQTGAIDGPAITIANDVDDLSIGTDAVWAVSLYGKTLARIDPSGRVTATVRTRGQASGVLVTASAVWLSNYDEATVNRLDPTRNAIVATYRVGEQPRGLAEAAGSIWVANQASNSVSRITP
jgi:streptogramin lyase